MKELTIRIVNFEMYGKLCSARLCFISRLRSLYIYGICHNMTEQMAELSDVHVVKSGVNLLKHLIITGVKFTDRELGRGAYGRVFAVDYNGITCAAKEIHSVLLESGAKAPVKTERIKQEFLQECLQHSRLHHPNIVKMLGVYYPNDRAVLPVLVMELMDCSLKRMLDRYQNIPMYVKLSILQDVSRAICYLHTLNPPLMHRDLDTNNVVLTTNLVAKITDVAVMKVASPLSSDRMTKVPGTLHFMPPEVFQDNPHYGLPLDVFSFGCVVCHVITEQWPTPSALQIVDSKSRKKVIVSEVERRKHYIDQISEGSLKQLVMKCLDDNQERRPPISLVSEMITSIITG